MASGAITKGFNAVLFLFVCYTSLVDYLISPENLGKVPWEKLAGASPTVMILGVIAFLLIYIVWGAALVRRLWNGWFADVFKVRQITFDESIAILLVVAVLAVG